MDCHLVRDFVIGIEHVVRAGDGIGDRDHRVRLAGSLERTEAGERHFTARAALAVAIKIARGGAMDCGAVGQSLRGFGRSGRRERRALHDFTAVQTFEAHEFDVIAERSAGPPGPPGPPCIMTSGAGGASCARMVPTPSSNAAASAVQAKHLRFISVSPLLSREVAKKTFCATIRAKPSADTPPTKRDRSPKR